MEFRKATLDDCEKLLMWRNDPETRKNSMNEEEVDYSTHVRWLRKVLKDDSEQLFIVSQDNVDVGTVRSTYQKWNNVYLISWTVAPESRGKGYGKKMVREFVHAIDGVCAAEIKEENVPSRRIAEKAGLDLVESRDGILYFEES